MTKLEEFLEVLRLERLRRRVKQGDLADELNVKQGAVCNWESLRTMPTDEHLRAWAALLDVAVPQGVVGTSTAVAACGTISGRRRHLRDGEPVCDPCRVSYNRYQSEYRKSMRTGPP